MNQAADSFLAAWLASDIGEIDGEIARLATLCHIRLLDPGILERILEKDQSVCGTNNALAFAKLHDLVVMHFAVRDKILQAFGPAETARIIDHIIDDLRKRFADALAQRADTPQSLGYR